MKYICPLIVVEDIQRSRNFYEKILQQIVKFDFGENITFHGDFAIHLATHYKTIIDNKEIKLGANNFELYFEFENLEQIEQSLKDNNVIFIHHIRQQPWQQRVLRCYDPDNHIIEIGESMESVVHRLRKQGLSNEDIQKKTSLPIEFIEKEIK